MVASAVDIAKKYGVRYEEIQNRRTMFYNKFRYAITINTGVVNVGYLLSVDKTTPAFSRRMQTLSDRFDANDMRPIAIQHREDLERVREFATTFSKYVQSKEFSVRAEFMVSHFYTNDLKLVKKVVSHKTKLASSLREVVSVCERGTIVFKRPTWIKYRISLRRCVLDKSVFDSLKGLVAQNPNLIDIVYDGSFDARILSGYDVPIIARIDVADGNLMTMVQLIVGNSVSRVDEVRVEPPVDK